MAAISNVEGKQGASKGQITTQTSLNFRPKTPVVLERVDSSINSIVNIAEPLFRPNPAEIVFKEYEPYERYQTTLTLRNNDKVKYDMNINAH